MQLFRVLLLFCFFFLYANAATSCASRTSCSTCAVDTNCGWCLGSGVAGCYDGTAAGPAYANITCASWQFSVSQIIRTVPGFPVHPSVCTLHYARLFFWFFFIFIIFIN